MANQCDDVVDLYCQKICCVNNAAFVMDFAVENANGKSIAPYSSSFPINQSHTIDLEQASGGALEVGSLVYPYVRAYAGLNKSGARIRYAPNGQIATYSVSGTTLIYSVELIK